ncbi:MAG: prolipoprotein diacylglyceryl transferase [Chloroflexi bacterium]|nr:prolipoprotein diacylglyceryl transferase [Chloroflexota bacterium]
MTISIDPVVFAIGGVAVRWLGVFVLVGAIVGTGVAVRDCRRQGVPTKPLLHALAWALPVGVIFARVVNVLGWWDYYLTHSADIWRLNLQDGLSLWGGIVAGGLVTAARLRHTKSRRRRLMDAAVTGLLVAVAIGRVGEFLDGHGQGLPSDLPWATRYSSPLSAVPDFNVTRHPAQLYDALVCAVLLIVMTSMRNMPAGARTAVFLIAYGAARIGLGMLRLDPAFLFGLQIDQLLAAGCVLFGIWYAVGLERTQRLRRIQPDVQRPDSIAA